MATQFRYQTPVRVAGSFTGIGEDYGFIDLNLDGRKEIIIAPSNLRRYRTSRSDLQL